jgi:methionine-rich copper-binding protein CopC
MPALRRVRVTLAAGAAALVVLAVTGGIGAAPASAHASLLRAVPGDGATVTTAPSQVRLVFDEAMRAPASIVVTGPSGARVQTGTVRVRDNAASVRVDVTAAGRYSVAFRVVSEDGHPVSAQTSFQFAPGGSAQPGAARPVVTDGGWNRGRVIGIVAGVGLLAGLALLTVRRMPGGVVNPGRSRSGRRDSP